MEHTFAEPRSWQAGIGSNSGKFACVACNDYRWRRHVDARRHETTDVHRRALRHFLSNVETLAETTSSSVAGPSNIAQPDLLSSMNTPLRMKKSPLIGVNSTAG
ncbi:hypothetical protein C8Q75DRAFT_132349 [Abortiporus biennis]|nr:hypothetical protein C8Q75DRAFT_497003 [Abortiporus biennis]KAI0789943.1 hypothetical protein C8Q75DRAFT_132349 [Abortiporus biennis]